MTNRRRIGDFSMGQPVDAPDNVRSIFKRFLMMMDLTRWVVLYIRKSNPMGSGERNAYLERQEALHHDLIAAGVPEEKIIVLSGDTGKSAALSRKFRADLNRVHDLLNEKQIGTIVAVDVARLFRDMWMKEPTDFAAKVAWGDARVLTSSTGDWKLLNMRDAADKNLFMRMAEDAANYRLTLRKQSMEAREEKVGKGAFGGGPAPLGWAAKPAIRKSESVTGIGQPAQLEVYPPHVQVKLAIWEASLLPSIASRRQLYRHVHENGLFFPPFTEDVRRAAFTRSCARGIYRIVNGKRIRLKSDEWIIPSEAMLVDILLHPLAIGDFFFGSGNSGKYYKRKLEEYANAMRQPCDTWIRDYREYVGNFPELACCKTSEEVAMYWAVREKWSRIDPIAEKNSGYEVIIPNAVQSAGLRWTGQPYKREHLNHWVGKVFCLKHGINDEGEPLFTHRLHALHQGKHWKCSKDYDENSSNTTCSFWSCDNALGRIIDAHLKRGIKAALQSKGGIIEDLVSARDNQKQRVIALKEELKRQEEEEAYQCTLAEAYGRRLQGKADFAAAITQYYEEHVTPVTMNVAEKRRDLLQAEAEGLTSTQDCSEREVSEMLRRAVEGWDKITLDERMSLVSEFVDHVGVFMGEDPIREVFFEFVWRNGVRDHLISWRGPSCDYREWKPEEDAALRELWPSQCPWEEIVARLQPDRKFSSTYRRALALGITQQANRSNAWRQEIQKGERCWGDNNPDALYLQWKRAAIGDDEEKDYSLEVREDGTNGRFLTLPVEVAYGLQVIQKTFSSRTEAPSLFPSGPLPRRACR